MPKNNQTPPTPYSERLIELAYYKMPFGKHKGTFLSDIPEAYYVWFKQKGFPAGKLGRLMQEMLELKINGLSLMLRKIRALYPKPPNL